jgi:amino acid adenylation domain-containing protein
MLVHEFLEQSTDKHPDKIALICKDQRLSFAAVEGASNRLAHAMDDAGLERQDRVAVYLEPSVEVATSVFAALKAGGVFIVINPQVKASKASYILNDCQIKILVTNASHLREIAAELPACPHLKTIVLTDYERAGKELLQAGNKTYFSYKEIMDGFTDARPEKRCIDIDLASLIYTSGSTAQPKGVMLTHLNMVTAATSVSTYLENTPDDIILNVMPLSFDYGLYQLLMAMKFGGTLVQERSFLYPYETIDLLIKENVTGFPIVPTVAAILFKLKNLEDYEFPSLRYISNTAQALPPQYILDLQRIFPKAKIYSMYGLTECKRVSYLPPAELERRPTSVGKAMPNCETYIVGDEGNKVEEAGKIGELVVRGANVMKGYWNLPEETDQVLKPGPLPGEKVLYTGDLFKMDEEGFLYFVSRKDDILKVAGERISPKEIETVLHGIDGVSEAAVIGVNDDILGQAIKAFVVLTKDATLTEKDITKYCSRHMEHFMVPKYVEMRDSLPRSSHGKVDKKKLKAEAEK